MRATYFIRLVHSRAFGVATGLLAAIAACLYFFGGYGNALTGNRGLVLPSANEWLPDGTIDFAAGMAGAVATIVLMLTLNKVYNILRSMTSLYIALFAAMELATPDFLTHFYTGTLLSVVVPLCLLLLFSCYREPASTRHVFLIFLLLSFFTATQYCFAVYIPAFLLGLAQMRIFNPKALTAAFLGLLTPWWLLFGFGVVNLQDISLPAPVSIFSVIADEDTWLLLATIGITVFVTLVCFVLNLLKTIAYNARARAYNGAFTVLTLLTVAAICIDYRNLASYVPLLYFCSTIEISHFFSTHRAEKSFIPILLIIAAYAAIFICQTAI